MKKLLAAVALSTAFAGVPSFAMAQATAPAAASATAAVDPQTTAAVKQMLDAMEVRKMMAASFAEMQKALPQMMRAQVGAVINADTSMDAARKQEALAKVEQILPGAVDAVAKVFRDPALIDEMMAEMVPLYANNYTTAEIKELTRFYGTPLGRKMLALTPRLSAESMAIGQRIVTPRLNNLMQDIMQAAAQAK